MTGDRPTGPPEGARPVRRALLGLGSNLGDRRRHLAAAVAGLGPEVAAVSDLYETDPVGGPDQGPYLNLVVMLRTAASGRELLERARALEAAAERVRTVRWGPRTLDVDVLWIEGEVVDDDDLQVPHPRMAERAFVMVPVADVASDVAAGWEGPAHGVRSLGPLVAPSPGRRLRVIGPGRAGRSLQAALAAVGWEAAPALGRVDDPAGAADEVDLVVIATPDAVVAEVARAVRPRPEVVVAHLAGSLGLDVLAPHARRASIHPLVALPTPEVGAERLRAGAWFAVAGDPLADEVAAALGGRTVVVSDEHRAAYHAAACIASNHLVALLGQVERVAAPAGVPLEAFVDLARGTLDNVAALGPARALTGPAARGDEPTLARHRQALDPSERAAYDVLVDAARRLASGEPDEPDEPDGPDVPGGAAGR